MLTEHAVQTNGAMWRGVARRLRDGGKVALVCGNWPCKRAQLRDQRVINA
jgi:hypothetical protein